jgi:hypothetical protein
MCRKAHLTGGWQFIRIDHFVLVVIHGDGDPGTPNAPEASYPIRKREHPGVL